MLRGRSSTLKSPLLVDQPYPQSLQLKGCLTSQRPMFLSVPNLTQPLDLLPSPRSRNTFGFGSALPGANPIADQSDFWLQGINFAVNYRF